MQPINLFITTFVLTCLVFFPGPARADDLDDLAGTMEVSVDVDDLDSCIPSRHVRPPEYTAVALRRR